MREKLLIFILIGFVFTVSGQSLSSSEEAEIKNYFDFYPLLYNAKGSGKSINEIAKLFLVEDKYSYRNELTEWLDEPNSSLALLEYKVPVFDNCKWNALGESAPDKNFCLKEAELVFYLKNNDRYAKNNVEQIQVNFEYSSKDIANYNWENVTPNLIISSLNNIVFDFFKRRGFQTLQVRGATEYNTLSNSGQYLYNMTEVYNILKVNKTSDNDQFTYIISEGYYNDYRKNRSSTNSKGPSIVKITIYPTMYHLQRENNTFILKGKDIREVDTYSLVEMVNYFLEDCKANNINIPKQNVKATFEVLDSQTIASSYGKGDNNNVKIRVNPKEWSKSDLPTKWYIIYHELGHDILNLEHGEGGKMMFNYSNQKHSWDEFFEDKKTMFEFYNKWN